MSFHLYDIREIFSDAEGSVQFVELAIGGFNFEHLWQGLRLAVSQGAESRSFVFPSNLPASATANTSVLIGTESFAALGVVAPDFVIPDGFLFTTGGTLDFAGADRVTYGPLPTDGVSSIGRSGIAATNSPTNFAGQSGSVVLATDDDPSDADNLLNASEGDETLDGGEGVDTAVFPGNRADYLVGRQGTAFRVDDQSGSGGSDTLLSIEHVRFDDGAFELVNPPRSGTPSYGGDPAFLFDAVFYLLANPDLAASVSLGTAATHYLSGGAAEGRHPNSWFDPDYYGARWDDLAQLGLDDATLFMHYNLYGVWEGRSAGPVFDRFDGERYLNDNPDVAAYVDANLGDFLGSRSNGSIAHYVIYGADEQRPAFDLVGQSIDLGYMV